MGRPSWTLCRSVRWRLCDTTAWKALHELGKQGRVTRVKGRGTFVRSYTLLRAINRISGVRKNVIEPGPKPSTRLIRFHLRSEEHRQVINGCEFRLKGPFCEIEGFATLIA